jgi:hypothetical protein
MADNEKKPDNAIAWSEALSDFFNSPEGEKLAKKLAEQMDNPEGLSIPKGDPPIVRVKGAPPIVTTRVVEEPGQAAGPRLEDMDMPVPEKRREASRRALAPRHSQELEADESE